MTIWGIFGSLQNIAHTVSQQYAVYEDIFFSKLKEGVHTISRYPNVAYGVLGVTTLLALRTPRKLLFRLTIGRFQSEEAMYARAEAKVKEMRQSVDLLKNETRKLEVCCMFFECGLHFLDISKVVSTKKNS
jgi:hypothetical protein